MFGLKKEYETLANLPLHNTLEELLEERRNIVNEASVAHLDNMGDPLPNREDWDWEEIEAVRDKVNAHDQKITDHVTEMKGQGISLDRIQNVVGNSFKREGEQLQQQNEASFGYFPEALDTHEMFPPPNYGDAPDEIENLVKATPEGVQLRLPWREGSTTPIKELAVSSDKADRLKAYQSLEGRAHKFLPNSKKMNQLKTLREEFRSLQNLLKLHHTLEHTDPPLWEYLKTMKRIKRDKYNQDFANKPNPNRSGASKEGWDTRRENRLNKEAQSGGHYGGSDLSVDQSTHPKELKKKKYIEMVKQAFGVTTHRADPMSTKVGNKTQQRYQRRFPGMSGGRTQASRRAQNKAMRTMRRNPSEMRQQGIRTKKLGRTGTNIHGGDVTQ